MNSRSAAVHRNNKSNAVLAQKASENTVSYFGRFPKRNKWFVCVISSTNFEVQLLGNDFI